ncbi:MAG TPA: cyclic nucleotide-binding domain-containing protein [Acidimicrobiales bacterium]|nr:cyclic nucleotide-binding domain-containing protein [Acidimicrobiales bacterium]
MARSDEKLEHLGQIWLFASLSKRDLQRIARACDEVEVTKGRVLCEEGAPGHEFFLIRSGEASVRRKGKKVATIGPGGYFGELALLNRLPRNATVTAETDMGLLVLGQREFSGLLDEVPSLSHKLLEAMAARLREADARISA